MVDTSSASSNAYLVRVLFVLFSCSCHLPLSSQVSPPNIHKHMTTDDLRRVFHVENHSDVPDYEVVRVHSITKREVASSPSPVPERPDEKDEGKDEGKDGVRRLQLTAFGREVRLSLKRTPYDLYGGDGLRVWTAAANSTGHLHYEELPQEPIGETFQDEESQAAILLHRDATDGSLLLEGTIGHDLVVRPVPASVRQHLDDDDDDGIDSDRRRKKGKDIDDLDDELFMDDEMAAGEDYVSAGGFPLHVRIPAPNGTEDGRTVREDDPLHSHIVYRRDFVKESQLGDYAFMEPDDLPQTTPKRSKRSATIDERDEGSRTKREAPYVIYPEILVIVDYDGYRLHGGDNVQIKRYFVSFWNGVDLRYKLLKGPKIRISIAGIIISRGRDATPYLERNRVGRDAIDSAAALTDMGKYLFRERRLPVYDIAVAVTKLDMCRRQYPNEACNRGTAGFAYVGGACVVNKRLEKVNSVAIIEDTGGFSGIIVAAHEVGHLLGAVHDGSPPPTYLGGPGAEKCRWEDGFIMSDLRHTEKGFKWSPCSVASFHHFLNGDTATCLFNSPHEDESLPRVLPGKLLTLDAQCRKDRGTSACFKDDRVCAQLFCFDAGSGYCVAYRPAAEGSPCGDGQFCTNGRCVAEHENIIPDYSQNTPAYLRRSDTDSAATQSRPYYAAISANHNQTTIRSEWNDFWRTALAESTTTSPTKTNYNYYFNNNNNINNRNSYDPLFTTPLYNNNNNNNDNSKYHRTTTTAKYSQIFNNYNNNNNLYQTPTLSTTTRNPYDFGDFGRGKTTKTNDIVPSYFYSTAATPTTLNRITTKNVYEEYNRQFYSNQHRHSGAPTTSASAGEAEECVDTATNINCAEFLARYGYQYCGTNFIRKHCCAAQMYLCDSKAYTTPRQRRRR